MTQDIKALLRRVHATFLQDLAGVAALGVILIGGLYLPGVV